VWNAQDVDNSNKGELHALQTYVGTLRGSLTATAITNGQQIEAEVAADVAQQQEKNWPIASEFSNQTAPPSILDPLNDAPCKGVTHPAFFVFIFICMSKEKR